jgi:hypothetical protein
VKEHILVKVYGCIYPASDALCADLDKICAQAVPRERSVPILRREEEMLHISFEGLHFPEKEVLETLTLHPDRNRRGKLDVLDIEHWLLTRHVFDGGLRSSRADLNSVLDYAGL